MTVLESAAPTPTKTTSKKCGEVGAVKAFSLTMLLYCQWNGEYRQKSSVRICWENSKFISACHKIYNNLLCWPISYVQTVQVGPVSCTNNPVSWQNSKQAVHRVHFPFWRGKAQKLFLHAETALPVGGDIFNATKPVVSIKCIKNIAGSFIDRNY